MSSTPYSLPSKTHLVLLPSYNTGAKVVEVVREALAHWQPVWVVVDGSTDGTDKLLQNLATNEKHLKVLVLKENRGKGGAILHALDSASRKGFTHVLCMDADGQHPAVKIRDFMVLSHENPDAMVFGKPVFDSSAPFIRVYWRQLSNIWANLETLWGGIGDSLFGFKLYPIADLRHVMHGIRWARRYDFDPEVNVRLCWEGVKPITLPCPVRYFTAAQGGVSHFKYLRDNCLLFWMHVRLFAGFLIRLPLAWKWRRWKPISQRAAATSPAKSS